MYSRSHFGRWFCVVNWAFSCSLRYRYYRQVSLSSNLRHKNGYGQSFQIAYVDTKILHQPHTHNSKQMAQHGDHSDRRDSVGGERRRNSNVSVHAFTAPIAASVDGSIGQLVNRSVRGCSDDDDFTWPLLASKARHHHHQQQPQKPLRQRQYNKQ